MSKVKSNASICIFSVCYPEQGETRNIVFISIIVTYFWELLVFISIIILVGYVDC